MAEFPKTVTIMDGDVIIDGESFPYHLAEPTDEGYELLEAADDHMAYLVLKVMLPRETGSTRTVIDDLRQRTRDLADMWDRGYDVAGTPSANQHLVTGDHELGLAWRGGFDAMSSGKPRTANPYRIA